MSDAMTDKAEVILTEKLNNLTWLSSVQPSESGDKW
jgi:hypothetical protein